jgi:hypothetical protein
MYFLTLLTDFVDNIDTSIQFDGFGLKFVFLFSAQLAAVSGSPTHDVITSVAHIISSGTDIKSNYFGYQTFEFFVSSIRSFDIKH